jgi:hypothetical protein
MSSKSKTIAEFGNIIIANDGTIDSSASDNFTITPTGATTLTFTNISAMQSGTMYIDNTGDFAITGDANVNIDPALLTEISLTGTHWLEYYTDGTTVHIQKQDTTGSATGVRPFQAFDN